MGNNKSETDALRDCFAYCRANSNREEMPEEHCKILTEMFCKNGDCKFYKLKRDVKIWSQKQSKQ